MRTDHWPGWQRVDRVEQHDVVSRRSVTGVTALKRIDNGAAHVGLLPREAVDHIVFKTEVEDSVAVAGLGRLHAKVVRILEKTVCQSVLADIHAVGDRTTLAVAGDQNIFAAQVVVGGVILD